MAEIQPRPSTTTAQKTSAAARAHAAQQLDLAMTAYNDRVLYDPALVGSPLLTRWRDLRARWATWYRGTTSTTWWWEATQKLVESYQAELGQLEAAYARIKAPPAPLRVPVRRPGLGAASAPLPEPESPWSLLFALGAVGLGLWWVTSTKKKVAAGAEDKDFGVKRLLAKSGSELLGIDSAQVPELQFETLDIEDDDDEEEEDEFEDDFGVTMVRSPRVPDFYVPKSWVEEEERAREAERAPREG